MCTITKHLEIRLAKRFVYDALARFHYRSHCPAVCAAIYAMYDTWHGRLSCGDTPVGIIVYTMPAMELAARNTAIGEIFEGCRSREQRMKIINENIRRISRVIIDPRYRGLGLAARLVRETMPLINVPIVEAIAVMGRVNPFFEKAGMRAYPTRISHQCGQMLKALKTVGIEQRLFIQPREVQRRFDAMDGRLKFWLEHQIKRFLNAYGKRRNMPPGLERTRFILSKLTAEPIYYIWCRGDS